MLHVVAVHLHLMRPDDKIEMVVVEEALGDVFSEHGSRLATRGLSSLAVHGIGPENVLQQSRHAVGESIDLLDVAEQDAVLLKESSVEDEDALLQQGGDGQRLEAFSEELHDGPVVFRPHFAVEAEHLVDLSVSEREDSHRRLVVATEDEEAVRLHQLVAEDGQRHLHGEVASVGEIAWISVVARSYR